MPVHLPSGAVHLLSGTDLSPPGAFHMPSGVIHLPAAAVHAPSRAARLAAGSVRSSAGVLHLIRARPAVEWVPVAGERWPPAAARFFASQARAGLTGGERIPCVIYNSGKRISFCLIVTGKVSAAVKTQPNPLIY